MSEAWRNVAPSLLTCHLLTVSWRGDGTDPARMLSRPLSPQLVPNNGAGGGAEGLPGTDSFVERCTLYSPHRWSPAETVHLHLGPVLH